MQSTIKGNLNNGLKYDSGKQRWDLLPVAEIEGIVDVLTFGANKYTDNSWQNVDNGIERYYSALMRHIIAWRKGELKDEESGIDHLYHALTNLVFISWLEKNGKKTIKASKTGI